MTPDENRPQQNKFTEKQTTKDSLTNSPKYSIVLRKDTLDGWDLPRQWLTALGK